MKDRPMIPEEITAGMLSDDESAVGILTFRTSEGDFDIAIDDNAMNLISMAMERMAPKLRAKKPK
jgi:hypothetical protein